MPDLNIVREIELLRFLLEQIIAIENFTSGFDEDQFLRDELVKNASLMKLFVLGEYSIQIDDKLKGRFTEVQWQLMKAARNYYAHVYRGINWKTVWGVIETELPTLKPKIENIIVILEKEEQNAETN